MNACAYTLFDSDLETMCGDFNLKTFQSPDGYL